MGTFKWLFVLLLAVGLGFGPGLSKAEANGSSSTDNLGPGHNEWSNDPILYGKSARQGITGSGEFGGSTGTQTDRHDNRGKTPNPGGSVITPGLPGSSSGSPGGSGSIQSDERQ